jgi:hypothetical protein
VQGKERAGRAERAEGARALYIGAGSNRGSVWTVRGWESKGTARRRESIQRDSTRAGRVYR